MPSDTSDDEFVGPLPPAPEPDEPQKKKRKGNCKKLM